MVEQLLLVLLGGTFIHMSSAFSLFPRQTKSILYMVSMRQSIEKKASSWNKNFKLKKCFLLSVFIVCITIAYPHLT